MPTYNVSLADGRVASIPAPDSASALRAARTWAAENPVETTPGGLARSFGSGVVNGVTSLGNIMHPGGDPDYLELAQRGGQWLARHVGGQSPAKAQAGYDAAAAARRALLGPTSTEAQQAVHLYHAPQNEPERVADTLGAFLPNAFLGGGGLATRAARVAIPAATSEGARYGAEKAGLGPLGQTLASLVGNAAGNAFIRPRVTSSLLPATKAAKTAMSAGIPLTWGQQIGGTAKALEDHFTAYPVLGAAIQGARNRGVEAFNRALANAALEPLNQTLPATVAVGPDMVRHLESAVNAAAEDLGKNVGQIRMTPYLHRMVYDHLNNSEDTGRARYAEAKKAIDADILRPIEFGVVNGENVVGFHDDIGALANSIGVGEGEEDGAGHALLNIYNDMTKYIDDQYPGYADAKARLTFARDMTHNIAVAQDFNESGGPMPVAPMRLMESIGRRYRPKFQLFGSRADQVAVQMANDAYNAFGQDPEPNPTAGRLLSGGGLLALGLSPAAAVKPWAALGLASLPYQSTGRGAARWFANAKPNFDPDSPGPAPLPENAVKMKDFTPEAADDQDPANGPGAVVPFSRPKGRPGGSGTTL